MTEIITERVSLLDLQINEIHFKGFPGLLVGTSMDEDGNLDVKFSGRNGIKTQDDMLELLELAVELLKENGAVSTLPPAVPEQDGGQA